MQTTTVTLGEYTLSARIYDAVVVGTGCAGFNAADRLYSSDLRIRRRRRSP